MKLLSRNNPKIAKGRAKNYLTGVLHLAPFKLSGFNVCPMAEIAGCVKTCLNTAGRGGISKDGIVTYDNLTHCRYCNKEIEFYKGAWWTGNDFQCPDGEHNHEPQRTNRVQEARIRRTRLFIEKREEFMTLLADDIRLLIRRAKKRGMTPAIRLNGTSDIRWEDIPVEVKASRFNRTEMVRFENIFAAFPAVQFYDYTKLPNRRVAHIPNYHLTFSYSGSPVFRPYVDRALKNYGPDTNVSVVFHGPIPENFLDRPVINGDEHDLRFLDPKGCIVALKAKGSAKKDTSGFVIHTGDNHV
jgi:hypothetical protein